MKAFEHKGANHLLIRGIGSCKFSYVSIPSYLTTHLEESALCFTNHSDSNWDPKVEQCCLREDGHVHAHVHHGDLIEDILLEQCMDEAGCTLPWPWDSLSSYLKPLSESERDKEQHHAHSEECGHEQITHGDHLDCLVPMSDGSYLLGHDDGASSHGRLVKIGEPRGRLRRHSKQFFDLFKYEGPQYEALNERTTPDSFTRSLCFHSPAKYEHLERNKCSSEEGRPIIESLAQEEVVSIAIGHDTEPVKLQKTTIDVLGICCPAEIPLVKKILEPVPGVQEVYVNVAAKMVTIHHDPVAVPPARLVKLLNAAQLEASIHITGKWKAAHKWPTSYTMAAGLLMAVAMFQYIFSPLKWVALGAVAVGAPPILMKSFASLQRCILDINVLMLIAVAGAVGLGDYIEAGSITFLFTLADWLEFKSTDKARLAISSVASLAPQNAVLADSGLLVNVTEVKVGTKLSVKAGESIPIDGIVVSGRSAVDESSLTGESYPIEKEVGGRVWAGTINLSGYLCIEASALAEESAVARMVKLVEEAQTQRSNLDQSVDTFAKYYTPSVVACAIAIAVIPVIVHVHNIRHWLYLALVLLVVACPCALVISTPISITCAIAQAARTGLIVKGGKCLEALGKIKVIAMDKTGTLTEGCFQVVEVQLLNKSTDLKQLLHWISSIESKASHPISSAIVEYAKEHGIESHGHVDDFKTLVGEGVSGVLDGHEVVIGNDHLASRLQWSEGDYDESCTVLERWKSQGLTICWAAVDGKAELILSAGDQPRAEAAEAVKHLKDLGLHIAMLTGDSLATAMTIQKKLGEIEVHAQLFPEGKVEVLKSLKKRGLIGMVGDGINDAPALVAADVGIAMGVAGTAIAMEKADIALMKNDLRKLAMAIKLGRKARTKIQQNIFLSVATKILVIVLAASGYASLWGAVVADVGTCLVVIFNSMLILERDKHKKITGLMQHHKHAGTHCGKSTKCGKKYVEGPACALSTEAPSCCKSRVCDGGSSAMDEHESCIAKACCNANEKHTGHGIRRRVNHKDTCGKDCQGVDCSSVVVTISEEPCHSSAASEHASVHSKRPLWLEKMLSKRHHHVCSAKSQNGLCEQEAAKSTCDSKKNSRCCGGNSSVELVLATDGPSSRGNLQHGSMSGHGCCEVQVVKRCGHSKKGNGCGGDGSSSEIEHMLAVNAPSRSCDVWHTHKHMLCGTAGSAKVDHSCCQDDSPSCCSNSLGHHPNASQGERHDEGCCHSSEADKVLRLTEDALMSKECLEDDPNVCCSSSRRNCCANDAVTGTSTRRQHESEHCAHFWEECCTRDKLHGSGSGETSCQDEKKAGCCERSAGLCCSQLSDAMDGCKAVMCSSLEHRSHDSLQQCGGCAAD